MEITLHINDHEVSKIAPELSALGDKLAKIRADEAAAWEAKLSSNVAKTDEATAEKPKRTRKKAESAPEVKPVDAKVEAAEPIAATLSNIIQHPDDEPAVMGAGSGPAPMPEQPTPADVTALTSQHAGKFGADKTLKIIQAFGVSRAKDIPADKVAEFVAQLRVELGA